MNSTSLSTRGALAAAIATLVLGVGSDALAADAVTLQDWNGGGAGAAPAIGVGDTLTATKTLAKSSMADNPDLNDSAGPRGRLALVQLPAHLRGGPGDPT